MKEFYDKENKAVQNSTKGKSQLENGQIRAPDYSTRARN